MVVMDDDHQHIHKILFDDSQHQNDLEQVVKDEQHQNSEIVYHLLYDLLMKVVQLVVKNVQVIVNVHVLVVQLMYVLQMFDLNNQLFI
jgi:hypothetical protein